MRLETWDELDETAPIFCETCGKQLKTQETRHDRLCRHCKSLQRPKDEAFACWACGKILEDMGDIATGLCPTCRSDIIRKLAAK
jgi:DNA-directed RNA polymerase subunit RPC12/RpoP